MISRKDKDGNQDIKVPANESLAVQEQQSFEGHVALKQNEISVKQESVSVQSAERGLLAEQMSLERGSPTHFEPEVNS